MRRPFSLCSSLGKRLLAVLLPLIAAAALSAWRSMQRPKDLRSPGFGERILWRKTTSWRSPDGERMVGSRSPRGRALR